MYLQITYPQITYPQITYLQITKFFAGKKKNGAPTKRTVKP